MVYSVVAGNELRPVQFDALTSRFNRPPEKLCLLYGAPLIFRFALAVASQMLANGSTVAVVDGCNKFDPHAIVQFARQRCLNPDVLLNGIFVSRGFTCYQMEATMTRRLAPMLQRIHSQTAIIFGLLDTFYDEQAPFREVRQMLQRIIAVLDELKSDGVSVLLACQEWNVLPKERNQLLATLKERVDHVYRLETNGSNIPQLFLEHERSAHHGTYRTNLHEHYRA